MNQEKLKKLQAQVRIGGKGTPRRKKKVIHQTPGTDDKKLQSVLKKLAVNQIPGIEEVNMIKNDGTVIHFNNPKAQASLAANTFAITGHSEQKEVSFRLCKSNHIYFTFFVIISGPTRLRTHLNRFCNRRTSNAMSNLGYRLNATFSITHVHR